jgi:NAD(P)-dependent dehydrogenase (short-subunit alcohol dehydrogenase family)
MAAEGAAVVVSDLALGSAEAVAQAITASGGTAVGLHVDVTSPELVQALVAETVARYGRIDALYHCAADVHLVNTKDSRLTELDDDIWRRIIDVHLTGTFLVLKHVGLQMLAQRSGSIIVSSTVDALVGCAGLDSYTAAKGGVTSMVRSFAAGVGRDGVRVNAIAPSFVSTESQMVWLDDAEARATIESLHILPIPTPEQVAPFVVYLASDESAAVTGTVFPIDAGYMAFKANVDVSSKELSSLGLRWGSVAAHLNYDQEARVVELKSLAAESLSGKLGASGRIALDGPKSLSQVSAELTGLDLAQALRALEWNSKGFSGKGSARINASWPGLEWRKANISAVTQLRGPRGHEAESIALSSNAQLSERNVRLKVGSISRACLSASIASEGRASRPSTNPRLLHSSTSWGASAIADAAASRAASG